MSSTRSLALASIVAVSLALFGCSSADSSESSSRVTLAGRVGGGDSSTRAFGGVSVDGSGVHVAARELHRRGETGRTIDVNVAADGTFRVDVERGARWVITIDDADGKSALLQFGDGESAISVSADSSGGTVDVGGIHVVGGEATTDVVIDGKLGLASTLAELDEVFEAADGAILAAQDAIDQAKKAADEARKAAEQAQADADAARKAAEDAANKAGNLQP